MVHYGDRIVADPTILNGKPVIRGTRIAVDMILSRLAQGASPADILDAWPHIRQEDILAALAYSAAVVSHEEMIAV
jgi:uncharacterized protein (DUF433 family)